MKKKNDEITETTMKNKKKRITKKKIILSIATIAVIGGGAGIVIKKNTSKAKAETGRTVFDTEVKTGNITNSIESSGTLASADEVYVQIPSSLSVDEVYVESGDKVSKGDKLASLNKASICNAIVDVENQLDDIEDDIDDADSDYEEEALNYQKEELEALKELLLAYYENPVIVATADGIIGDVNVSESGSNTSVTEGNNNLSENTSISIEANETTTLSTGLDTEGTSKAPEGEQNPPSNPPEGATPSDTTDQTTSDSTVIADYSKLIIASPKTGEAPQTSIEETDYYAGEISWDLSGDSFEAGKAYSATVILKAKAGYKFTANTLPTIDGASYTYEIDKDEAENTLKLVITYAKDTSSKGTVVKDEQAADTTKVTDDTEVSKDTKNTTTDDTTFTAPTTTEEATTTSVKTGSFSTGSSSSGSASAQVSSNSSQSNISYTNAFSIITTNTVKVTVNVDELDILSVSEGQSATITLDALENEEFTGTVSDVDETASSGNSSSKYAVEIEIPMDEDMRIGMSASASINISEANDVLTIPMTALQQKKGETFVYTSKDADGNLSGEVTVETGLSDGTNVEIKSGLSAGDTVYYYRETSESSSTPGDFSGFDFSKMAGDGNMHTPPSGDFSGERPSGFPGGKN